MSVTGDTPSDSSGSTSIKPLLQDPRDWRSYPPVESSPVSPAQRASRLPTTLNLGCGYDLMPDAVNVDRNVDIKAGFNMQLDLDGLWHWNLPADHFTEIYASHLIEHIHDTYSFMTSAWRVAAPGAKFKLRLPYGSSDDAWEDQTHVRPFFYSSFMAFSQQYHWRSDVGYKADWQPTLIELLIPDEVWRDSCPFEGREDDQRYLMWKALLHKRNIVAEMLVELEAIKPAREVTKGEKPEFIRPKINLVHLAPVQ